MKLYDIHDCIKIDDPDCETMRELCEKHKHDLRSADIRSADLRNADLRCADLYCADLRCADLSRANLYCADLSNADLRNADLRCADLGGVNLIGADLTGANLKHLIKRGSCHCLIATENQIQIGCQISSFDWWLENYAECGRYNGYTKKEIIEYKNYIDEAIKFFKE